MSYDDMPLPTKQTRRRSIFDDHNDSRQKENSTAVIFPTEPSEVNYPPEYVENVRTEIHVWKTHIKRCLEDLHKLKAEKNKPPPVVDESILSPEQRDLFASFNFEEYAEKAQKFCERAAIIVHKIEYKSELANAKVNELLALKSKLEKEVLKNNS